MYRTRGILIAILALPAVRAEAVLAEEAKPHRAEAGTLPASSAEAQITPTERMNRRFPQKAKVGDLLGLPLQDEDDRVLGRVEEVVRTPDGSVVLVMNRGGWFRRASRPVGVPLETVAILGRHINVLDLSRKEVEALPAWFAGSGKRIAPGESIRIAISRR